VKFAGKDHLLVKASNVEVWPRKKAVLERKSLALPDVSSNPTFNA
jgi:hypothetical protein